LFLLSNSGQLDGWYAYSITSRSHTISRELVTLKIPTRRVGECYGQRFSLKTQLKQ